MPLIVILLAAAPLLLVPVFPEASYLPKRMAIELLVWLALAWRLWRGADRPLSLAPAAMWLPLALGLIWSGVSMLWAHNPMLGFIPWTHWLTAGAAFMVVVDGLGEEGDSSRLARAAALGGLAVGIIGLAQALFGMAWIPQAHAPAATFVNKNIAAQYAVCAAPLALWTALDKAGAAWRWLGWAAFSALTGLIVFSGSRGSWSAMALFLALGPGVLLVWRFRPSSRTGRRLGAVALSILALAVMLAIPWAQSRMESSRSQATASGNPLQELWATRNTGGGGIGVRLAMWDNTLAMVGDHPWLGVGLGNWPVAYPPYSHSRLPDPDFSERFQPRSPHNEPLQALAETGPLGLALLIAFLAGLLWAVWRATRGMDMAQRWRVTLPGAGVLALAANSSTSFPLHMAMPPFMVMVLAGLVAGQIPPQDRAALGRPLVLRCLAMACLFLALGLGWFNWGLARADSHFGASQTLKKQGQWPAVLGQARQAASQAPHRHLAWFNQGYALMHLGRSDEAAQAFHQALARHPHHLNSLINLSHLALAARQWDQAEDWAAQALALLPGSCLAAQNLGLAREGKGDADGALAAYDQCAELGPAGLGARGRALVLRLKLKRYDQALEAVQRSGLEDDPPSWLRFHLGWLRQNTGDLDRAMAHYRAATSHRPHAARAHTQLGLLAARSGHLEQARRELQRALALEPNLAPAHYNLALVLKAQGRTDEAMAHARRARELGLKPAGSRLKGKEGQ